MELRSNALLSADGLYRYRGEYDNPEHGSQLVILPSGEGLTVDDFDPMSVFGNPWDPSSPIEDTLLQYHDTALDWDEASASDRETRRVIERQGDVVKLWIQFDSGEEAKTWEYDFDLARGGNLTSFHARNPMHETKETYTCEEMHGVWIPSSFSRVHAMPATDSRPARTSVKQIHLLESVVNEPIDETEFDLGKLGVQKGDLVVDRRIPGGPFFRRFGGPGQAIGADLSEVVSAVLGDPVVEEHADEADGSGTATAAPTTPKTARRADKPPASAMHSSRHTYVALLALVLILIVVGTWYRRIRRRGTVDG